MESITIYPKNAKQISLLKSLLAEMKIRFDMDNKSKDTLLDEKEFYAKIDASIQQAKDKKTEKLSKSKQKELLGL